MTVALIDADLICYAIGFAAKDDPVQYAYHSVNKMIDRILDEVGTDEYFCYLTGKGNFRDKIATIKPYKGNRKSEKPEHYQAIRDYLVRKHNAIIVNNIEADDVMSITQTKLSDTCICSIDKDMNTVPGKHYNWAHHGRESKLYDVSEMDAMRFLYQQMLMGDSTDNIQGIPGVGEKKSQSIINSISDLCNDAFIDTGENLDFEEELYWAVLEQYELAYGRPFEALLENARLVYLLREKDVMWEPPV